MANKPEPPLEPQDPNPSVLIPLKLDAFIFNSKVCDGIAPQTAAGGNYSTLDAHGAKIAPIEQPNYTFLRLDSSLIQPDIQNPVDLYNSWPSGYNSRFTNLGSAVGSAPPKPYPNRIGVYLHWTLPRMFRSGVAASGKEATKSKSFAQQRTSRGLSTLIDDQGNKSTPPASIDYATPVFPSVPNRWLVIRHIPNRGTIVPSDAQVPEFAAWVVESDRLWDLKDLELDVDLQTDVSPFIAAGGGSNENGEDNTVSKQAEVFIGAKTPLEHWKEQYTPKPTDPETSSRFQEDMSTANEELKAKFLPHFSLLTSSNQLFADYQPHNANVFSMCDNFEYGDKKSKKYLEQATAHYYVIGWYSEPQNDPFTGPLLGGDKTQKRREKLDALKLKIKLENPDGKQLKDQDIAKLFDDWLESNLPTQTVCHGAMYEVKWNSGEKPKNVPADTFCTQLNSTLPLAVGTTPLDAMTTYARAHTCLAPPEKPDDKDKVTIPKLEKWITELERHLLARDDGVESQNQASDMLYNWNYARSDGGQSWNAAGMDQKSSDGNIPGNTPIELVATLRELNSNQTYLDAIQRAITRVRRDMFSLWWRFVTDSMPDKKEEREKKEDEYKALVSELEKRFNALDSKQDACSKIITGMKDDSKMKKGARPAFYQQRDPTLLVGGVSSGWQHDYLDDLLVRIEGQVVGSGEKGEDATVEPHEVSSWDEFEKSFGDKFPKLILPAIKALKNEFHTLSPTQKTKPTSASKTASPPLFHDQYSPANPRLNVPDSSASTGDRRWRDRWNDSQPWFPLFMEWEVEYYHIPFEVWDLSRRKSRSSTVPQLRYGIPGNTKLNELELDEDSNKNSKKDPDKHTIQGRVLLLPQPSFSLGAKIEQLFAGTPQPILDRNHRKDEEDHYDYLSPKDRDSLQKELYQLAFLSAPLAGFSSHLTTVLQGNHIKPNMRNARTGALDPLNEALRPIVGFDEKAMNIIGIETDSTPFAKVIRPPVNDKISLFKPATHGQFRFTKLNIIDKFGQVIHAITPTASSVTQPVWPCISEWYAPQLKDDGSRKPNVIDPKAQQNEFVKETETPPECPDPPLEPCEFVQVPPMINQYARLNANFVVRVGSENETKTSSAHSPYSWRPADEWENPIWGWVLINYANRKQHFP